MEVNLIDCNIFCGLSQRGETNVSGTDIFFLLIVFSGADYFCYKMMILTNDMVSAR